MSQVRVYYSLALRVNAAWRRRQLLDRTLRVYQYDGHLRRKKHLKHLAERQRSQNDIALYYEAVL